MRIRDLTMLIMLIAGIVLAITGMIASKKILGRNVKRTLLIWLLMLVYVFFMGKSLLFPKMKAVETTGKYTVATVDNFYTREGRLETYTNDGSLRELPVTFWYPENIEESKKCPLVVFSHGSFGIRNSNISLYNELASNGYVVCAIDHTYMALNTVLSDGKKVSISMDYMKAMGSENPHKNPEKSVENFQNWMGLKMGDIDCVIDDIKEDIAKVNEGQSCQTSPDNDRMNSVYKMIDLDKICLIGHSLGGSAVLGNGRTRDDITAVICLESAFLYDVKGVDSDGQFIMDESPYPVPVLNIYSDSAWPHIDEWSQYQTNAKLLKQESDTVRNYHIEGCGHLALTDLSMKTPFFTTLMDGGMKNEPQVTLKKINELCLDFLNDMTR